MIGDTLVYSLLLISSIGGIENQTKHYITDHYILLESIRPSDGTPYNWLHDIRAGTMHILDHGEHKQVNVDPVEYGEKRAWVVVGTEYLGYEKMTDTTYQGCKCIILRENKRMPDPMSGGAKFTSFTYKVMCRVPEIEALPLQTRLNIPGYKEWIDEAYPMLMKEYVHDSPLPIIEKRMERKVPFPTAKVREWFGVEVGP